MFSGIVETTGQVLSVRQDRGLLFIDVEKPSNFSDLSVGDSICTNGVCLTIERFDEAKMTFALGAETLQITGWTESALKSAVVNLERSLRIGDRIHGHTVTGHVDTVGEVVSVNDVGGSTVIGIKVPQGFSKYVWRKGSWAVNGVSLTINAVEGSPAHRTASVCLIPETLRRTNLKSLSPGDHVNLEVDFMARGLVQVVESAIESGAIESLMKGNGT